jgi:hypothetical protein
MQLPVAPSSAAPPPATLCLLWRLSLGPPLTYGGSPGNALSPIAALPGTLSHLLRPLPRRANPISTRICQFARQIPVAPGHLRVMAAGARRQRPDGWRRNPLPWWAWSGWRAPPSYAPPSCSPLTLDAHLHFRRASANSHAKFQSRQGTCASGMQMRVASEDRDCLQMNPGSTAGEELSYQPFRCPRSPGFDDDLGQFVARDLAQP